MSKATLVNAAPVFATPNLRLTSEAFAAIYREGVEILLVQSEHGEFASNRIRCGAGYDIYLDPDTIE